MQRLFLKKWLFFLIFLSNSSFFYGDETTEEKKYKIGLCIMATGRYVHFAEQLIESGRKYFLTNHDVTYFVFTDNRINQEKDVVVIPQKRLGWPYDTMMRFEVYFKNKNLLQEMDYLFASDADMLFVAPIGEEILGPLVGTVHPGYVGRRGTYEVNPYSKAFVRADEGQIYFAGGFYGGDREHFFTLIDHNQKMIQEDLSKGIIPLWHDESHLNRYFLDHQPSIVLSPSYCYPESLNLPYPKKLLALDKNHAELRKRK